MNRANRGETGYLDLLEHILEHGNIKNDRTGVGTRSIFGAQLRFNLQEGFPLLTTKKMFTKGIFGELCWIIRGDTNIKYLVDNGIHIWDEWADERGELGPVYGKQWRAWDVDEGFGDHSTIDQLQNAVDLINKNPDSRRIMVTSWNPAQIDMMKLPPCHLLYQFEIHDGLLSCHMNMRSADIFLGVPFNIASYAALTELLAHITGLGAGDLIISFGDIHIYNNHVEQVEEQLNRIPLDFPHLGFTRDIASIDDNIEIDDFVVRDYKSFPAIKAPVAV